MTNNRSELSEAFRACRGALLSTGFFSLFINLLMLSGPLFMLQVYDRVLTSRSIPTLVALVILVFTLFVFLAALEHIRSRILVRIGRRIDEQVSGRIFDATIAHAVRRTPRIGAQPARDLASVRQFVAGPGPFALFDTPWTPIYLTVIFLMHPLLGVFATFGGAVLAVLAAANEFLTREPTTRAGASAALSNASIEESRRNAEAVSAMGMLRHMRLHWLRQHREELADSTCASDRAGTITAVSKATRMALQSGILAVGAYLAVRQEITPGMMIAVSVIMSRALAPVEQAITQWRSFLLARKAYDRLQAVLKSAPPAPDPVELPEPTGRISIEGLVAAAPATGKPLLHGISFALEPGDVVGVLGPSGAGKTTLARALVGAWPAARGAVRIDGAALDQWSDEQFGRAVGYLPQNIELFSGTIWQNICRFAPRPDARAIVEAARMADVHDLILGLPEGYRMMIDESGSALSAGQRQRIALARALYGKPKFVVLDEPNSNLDAQGESAVIQAILGLKASGATVVVIAHRPSAIRTADKILFLKEGHQMAFGPRDRTLARVLRGGDRQSMGSENVAALAG